MMIRRRWTKEYSNFMKWTFWHMCDLLDLIPDYAFAQLDRTELNSMILTHYTHVNAASRGAVRPMKLEHNHTKKVIK